MAPRLRFARRARDHDETKRLMRRDQSYDSGSESDYSDDEDDDHHAPAPTRVLGSNQGAITPTTITTSLTLSPPPRGPVQAAAATPAADAAADPRASINRVSEEGTHTGQRAGIAAGLVGGILLLLAAAYFVRRYRRNREKGGNAIQPPPTTDHPPTTGTTNTRTDSQILDELMTTAYAHQNGGAMSVWEEKKHPAGSSTASDTAEGVSFPVNLNKAKIRSSIASWLRRHHPLQLNSLSRWSSTTTSTVLAPPVAGAGASGSASRAVSTVVPPVPPMPVMGRQSGRMKSVWSDTTAETETNPDLGPSRHASVMTVTVAMAHDHLHDRAGGERMSKA